MISATYNRKPVSAGASLRLSPASLLCRHPAGEANRFAYGLTENSFPVSTQIMPARKSVNYLFALVTVNEVDVHIVARVETVILIRIRLRRISTTPQLLHDGNMDVVAGISDRDEAVRCQFRVCSHPCPRPGVDSD